MKCRLIILLLSVITVSLVHADGLSSLTLTDAEIQKLKKYFPAEETAHLIWKGDPLSIQLSIGQEKRIQFPNHVTVDVKGALNTDQLRILNNDKSIYLTALHDFPTTRIYVTLQESGEVILIDISVAQNASNQTQYIDIKEEAKQTLQTDVVTASVSDENNLNESSQLDTNSVSEDANYVDLIRFAWKEIYAPDRLLKEMPHYERVPMHTERFVLDLVYGDKVIAHPVSSWRTGDQIVTVVSLQNKYSHMTHIDIHNDLCGDWQAASIYPSATLQSHGSRMHDTATLFLISHKPFNETLGVCHGDA